MTERFVSVEENNIRYLDFGDSDKTLVLIHGLGASAERWEKIIPDLQKDFRVIVPDLIGFGQSDKPLVDYTVDFFSEFLKKFLISINVPSIFMIGSSLGGQVAAAFTSKNNEMVKKLTLVSPSGMMKHSTRALDAYIMAALYPNEQSAKMAFEVMSGPNKEVDSRTILEFVQRMKLPNAKMAFMSALLGLKEAQVISHVLEQIRVPSMVIWGKEDPVIPIKYSTEFVSKIRNCSFHFMNGSGHTPYVDNPKQFTQHVLTFFE